MKNKKRQLGFTLIELILTATILSVLLAFSSVAFQPILNSWATVGTHEDIADNINYAMNRMLGEISQVKNKNSVTTATASDFQFTDTSDSSIRFRLSSGNLLRNSDVLARGVSSLAFTYYDVNDNAIGSPAAAPNATNIWRIRVSLSLTSNGQTLNFTSDAHPRNFTR